MIQQLFHICSNCPNCRYCYLPLNRYFKCINTECIGSWSEPPDVENFDHRAQLPMTCADATGDHDGAALVCPVFCFFIFACDYHQYIHFDNATGVSNTCEWKYGRA